MDDEEIKPITPEHRQALYELDCMMAEYREALKDPNSKESKEWQRAQEIFAMPFPFEDDPEVGEC